MAWSPASCTSVGAIEGVPCLRRAGSQGADGVVPALLPTEVSTGMSTGERGSQHSGHLCAAHTDRYGVLACLSSYGQLRYMGEAYELQACILLGHTNQRGTCFSHEAAAFGPQCKHKVQNTDLSSRCRDGLLHSKDCRHRRRSLSCHHSRWWTSRS